MSVSYDTVIALCTAEIVAKFVPDQTVLQTIWILPVKTGLSTILYKTEALLLHHFAQQWRPENTTAVQTTVSCYPCLRLDICKVQVISWLPGGFADHSLKNTNLVGRDHSLSDHSEGQHCSSSLSVHSCCLQTEPDWRPPDNPQAQSCLDQQF